MNTLDALDTHTFPPGGWSYRQPQLNWSTPTPLGSTFAQTVELIRKVRVKNPAVSAKHNLSTDSEAIAQELLLYTRRRLKLPDNPIPKAEAPGVFSRPLGAVAAAGRAIAAGAKTLVSWLGDGGKPVSNELAEKRAAICVQCPNNDKGDWLRYFTLPATEILRKQLNFRNEMGAKTSADDQLQVCSVCKCPLKLKVFVPMENIFKQTSPDIQAALPSFCWIKRRDEI